VKVQTGALLLPESCIASPEDRSESLPAQFLGQPIRVLHSRVACVGVYSIPWSLCLISRCLGTCSLVACLIGREAQARYCGCGSSSWNCWIFTVQRDVPIWLIEERRSASACRKCVLESVAATEVWWSQRPSGYTLSCRWCTCCMHS
jgi:hypothetical protein